MISELVQFIESVNYGDAEKILIAYRKFSECFSNPSINVYSLIKSDIPSKLFALFPVNEMMEARRNEGSFIQLYSEGVMCVSNILRIYAVETCLIKHSIFVGNLVYLHGILKPSKEISTQLFNVVQSCHGSIFNEYSYCTLISMIGVEEFVDFVMNEKETGQSFLLIHLLPFLRKANLQPCALLVENIETLLNSQYNIVVIQNGSSPTHSLSDIGEEKGERGDQITDGGVVLGVLIYVGLLLYGELYAKEKQGLINLVSIGACFFIPFLGWLLSRCVGSVVSLKQSRTVKEKENEGDGDCEKEGKRGEVAGDKKKDKEKGNTRKENDVTKEDKEEIIIGKEKENDGGDEADEKEGENGRTAGVEKNDKGNILEENEEDVTEKKEEITIGKEKGKKQKDQ